eukprot:jgi/Galph1/1005/GphlegSOOS_G5889.1
MTSLNTKQHSPLSTGYLPKKGTYPLEKSYVSAWDDYKELNDAVKDMTTFQGRRASHQYTVENSEGVSNDSFERMQVESSRQGEFDQNDQEIEETERDVGYGAEKSHTGKPDRAYVSNTTTASSVDYKGAHKEVERKRRITISNKIEELRGLVPGLQQTRKPDVVTTLSATVQYVKATSAENEHLKQELNRLKEKMDVLSRQVAQHNEQSLNNEYQDFDQQWSLEDNGVDNMRNDSCCIGNISDNVRGREFHHNQSTNCPVNSALKIDHSFPWTRYIPPGTCDLFQASPEDLQRACQILQLLATVKNTYAFICDIRGHIVWISNSVEDVLGYQAEELLQSDIWSLLHPDDLDAVYPVVQMWHEIGYTSSVHLRRKRKDGSFVELKSCFTNLLSFDGDIEGCVCIEVLLEGTAERWLECLYRMDLNGRLTYCSPSVERITGYKPEELLGQYYYYNVHAEEQELVQKNLQTILDSYSVDKWHHFRFQNHSNQKVADRIVSSNNFVGNNISQTVLSWFRRKKRDGSEIWLVSLMVASVNDRGQPTGFISIEHDITMHAQRWASVLCEVAAVKNE